MLAPFGIGFLVGILEILFHLEVRQANCTPLAGQLPLTGFKLDLEIKSAIITRA